MLLLVERYDEAAEISHISWGHYLVKDDANAPAVCLPPVYVLLVQKDLRCCTGNKVSARSFRNHPDLGLHTAIKQFRCITLLLLLCLRA